MSKPLVIECNGVYTEVWLDGVKVQGLRKIEYTNSIEEIPILKMELAIIPELIERKAK
jgi:hypothetical protein